MSELSAKDKSATGQLKGHHVLIILLSAFAVVFGVNMFFAYKAIVTNNPRESAGAYEKGLSYNTQIAADNQQSALGWTHSAELTDSRTLRMNFVDKAGAPVTGLTISGQLGRPASDHFDRPVTFTETQPGVYTAATDELEAGGWLATLNATKPGAGGENVIYSVKDLLKWHMPADAKRKR
jgi:nitrogen fixation protein FixH